jgi:hypothetical protein
MTDDDAIWLGRDGQKFGPYTEAIIRQWLRTGQLTSDTLAWREGMAAWEPLSAFFAADPVIEGYPPPLPGAASMAARQTLPPPPSLHWFLIVLLAFFTFGIFPWVWMFVQSIWVKRIDPSNRATEMFVASMLIGALGSLVASMMSRSISYALLLSLTAFAVQIAAYFSMARSRRDDAARRGIALKIGGLTLFFFQILYLQSQMTWLARWKETGQTEPEASKDVFWLLLMIPAFFGLIIAIGILTRNYR